MLKSVITFLSEPKEKYAFRTSCKSLVTEAFEELTPTYLETFETGFRMKPSEDPNGEVCEEPLTAASITILHEEPISALMKRHLKQELEASYIPEGQILYKFNKEY